MTRFLLLVAALASLNACEQTTYKTAAPVDDVSVSDLGVIQ